jgi:PRTRC genetic system ThiF family protein
VIEKRYAWEFPRKESVHLVVVGAGGTGSQVIVHLARLAWHYSELFGTKTTMAIYDPDEVERKNIGRQGFSERDVGQNKAVVMSERINMWLGMSSVAYPQKLAHRHCDIAHDYGSINVIVGCVDGVEGREEMERVIRRSEHSFNAVWIDSGNGLYSGQVAIGTDPECSIPVKLDSVSGVAAKIPAPSIQLPELMVKQEVSTNEGVGCADVAVTGAQSVMINSAMASVVGRYVSQVYEGRVDTLRTYVNLDPVTAVSVDVTEKEMRKYYGRKVNVVGVGEPDPESPVDNW